MTEQEFRKPKNSLQRCIRMERRIFFEVVSNRNIKIKRLIDINDKYLMKLDH